MPIRKYWLNRTDLSPDIKAYLLRPSGELEPIAPAFTPSGASISFQTPMGDGPFHGVHNLYVVDRFLAGREQIVRTAKWITIHHNCGWGHDYKYDEEKIEAKGVIIIKRVVVRDDRLDVTWFGTRSIPWDSFAELQWGRAAGAIGAAMRPLSYRAGPKGSWGNIAIGAFENGDQIVQTIREKTGLALP